MKAFMKVKSATLGDHKPTWTAVGASGPAIPNARVEIRIIAEKR
jgi:enamine deaminase RidA (YjgF/YER057c/UK114 family)